MTKNDFEKNREQIIQAFLKGGDNQIESTNNYLDDNYLNEFSPLEVKVYGYNFEKAFKIFRNLVQKDRILSLYKQKQTYEKPSEKRRRKQSEMLQNRMELESRLEKIRSGEFEKELLKKQKLKELKKQMKISRRESNQG